MTDAYRERLIEILKLGSCPSPYLCDENCKYANLERCYEERTADLLLEHGVIVPPCKVGDTVWLIGNAFNGKKVAQVIVYRMIDGIGGNQLNPIWLVSKDPFELRFHPSDFSKTVFLTREEAEQALKGREKNNG